jgi:hypothetical protein
MGILSRLMSPLLEWGLGGIEGLILKQQTDTKFDIKLTPIPVAAAWQTPDGTRKGEQESCARLPLCGKLSGLGF